MILLSLEVPIVLHLIYVIKNIDISRVSLQFGNIIKICSIISNFTTKMLIYKIITIKTRITCEAQRERERERENCDVLVMQVDVSSL